MKLSICVVTMNRFARLREALASCLACELPEKTEFVVIDNASTDDTEEVAKTFLGNCGYDFYYEKLPENLGVGGGRNFAYSKSCGEYVYMLDDDAVIDPKNSKFFIEAVSILDENASIATLTTQIYDTAWKRTRVELSCGPKLSKGLKKCFMFCGGSHFLRRKSFDNPPYLSNKYGYEEFPPSLRVANMGLCNAFCERLLIIHKPLVNKWNYADKQNHDVLIRGIALPYAIKKMMYPKIAKPIVFWANKRREKLYLSNIKDGAEKVNKEVELFCAEFPIDEKISFGTLCKLFFDFGLSVF